MTQIPAGWYPDPAPQTLPGRQRYWDGAAWTEHVHDPQPVPQPAPPAYPPAYPAPYGQAEYGQGGYPQGGYGQAGYAPMPYGPTAVKQRPTTPDGQPLSGWWRRVLAVVLDGFIQIPLYLLATIPVLAWQWDELSGWFSDLSDSIDTDTARPPTPDIFDATSAPGLLLVLSILLATTLYSVVFLRWKQGTPGKLIVGVRVRERERPGPLPWSTITVRVGFVTALSLFAQVPVIGLLFGLGSLLDYLWPLWDSKNQALHDKVAGTNVVMAQPGQPGQLDQAGQLDQSGQAGQATPVTPEAGLPPRW
jgi:uncharacterized RDD family membrane protein YckC